MCHNFDTLSYPSYPLTRIYPFFFSFPFQVTVLGSTNSLLPLTPHYLFLFYSLYTKKSSVQFFHQFLNPLWSRGCFDIHPTPSIPGRVSETLTPSVTTGDTLVEDVTLPCFRNNSPMFLLLCSPWPLFISTDFIKKSIFYLLYFTPSPPSLPSSLL